ncbi:DUF1003 domain-containing protein [Xylanimonas oleitrophica]|uniref:DUF1003 domain-containing protein n=1 Tax=Xylanimonas oleitrophica TaxID=2607479 RepID=A0A2W5WUZ1_9MICO|nr:DUF1003 domain-containing protein [Xylanimonas oleitrophica]PZR54980.1 DUF1003 domain-containing protein [Xylanimonas oleitrophica]
MADRLDTPKEARRQLVPRLELDQDAVGKATEGIARFLGTPRFLIYLTVFCALWLGWNAWGPEHLRFDSAEFGFTALTLMLSLQASYAAPLILLAQNRQDDRDRVMAEQDRQRGERNLADTEYLAREMAALRLALSEVATRDFVRSELRNLLEELEEQREAERAEQERAEQERADQERSQRVTSVDGSADRAASDHA